MYCTPVQSYIPILYIFKKMEILFIYEDLQNKIPELWLRKSK